MWRFSHVRTLSCAFVQYLQRRSLERAHRTFVAIEQSGSSMACTTADGAIARSSIRAVVAADASARPIELVTNIPQILGVLGYSRWRAAHKQKGGEENVVEERARVRV